MSKFISRIRKKITSTSQKGPVCAVLNRERLQEWRAKYEKATGTVPTNVELLEELDRAIEEYNGSRHGRSVV